MDATIKPTVEEADPTTAHEAGERMKYLGSPP